MGKKSFFARKRKFDKRKTGPNDDKSTIKSESKPMIRTFVQLKDTDLGITEYTTDQKLFMNGIIKSRYSDFHVHEIGLDGEEAKLTTFEVPRKETGTNSSEETTMTEQGLLKFDKFKEIQSLVKEKKDDKVEIDVTDFTKEQRQSLHQTLKRLFGRKIVNTTMDVDTKKVIEVKRFNPGGKERAEWAWPEEYVHFILYKENIDTVQAINALAGKTGLRPSFFSYAGTKDRRAKTSQWVSVRQVEPFRIANGGKRLHNVFVGNFTFKKEPLKLGHLAGNRFNIVLRNVTTEDDVITKTVEKFKQNGFINYFGHQRFGNSASVPTYQIGKALLKQEWQEACELIMKPREGDPEDIQKMREHWQNTKDSKTTREMLKPYSTFVEAKLLDGFIKTAETDYMGALDNVPRNMRLLYLHAYQSLIWNKLATRRVKEMGHFLHVGDLVYKEKDEIDLIETPEAETNEAEDGEEEKNVESYFKKLVRPLTVQDIKSGNYSVFDIVMPLPGHDITYPSNDTAKWYEELLAEDGLTSDSLKQKHKVYSLPGTYRKLFAKPISFDYSIKNYDKHSDNLILSDLELLRNVSLPEISTEATNKAVIIDMSLQSATYATMALRELLKCDTSPAAQIASANLIKEEDNHEKIEDNNESEEPLAKRVKVE